jgi:hypothetical protein
MDNSTMTEPVSTVPIDLQREALRLLIQTMIELEVSRWLEASPHERSQNRRAYRNGYRQRQWRSRLGFIPLYIPKLRTGSFYPALLDSLEQAETDLLNLVDMAFRDGHVTPAEVAATLQKLSIETFETHHLAELADQLHDLVERSRVKLEVVLPGGKPTAALATQYLDLDMPPGKITPLALLGDLPSDRPSDDSIELLSRVRQALLHELDAIAA